MDEPLAIPFHSSCFDLLSAKIGAATFRSDILYLTFSIHLKDSNASFLSLEWGLPRGFQGQHFSVRKGYEGLLLCPTDISPLQQYYAALRRTEAPVRPSQEVKNRQSSSAPTDIFATLPAEMLLLVLNDLSTRDLFALRQASAKVNDLDLTGAFWKGRVARDMPWLYDIPSEARKDECIDWYSVYKNLSAAGQQQQQGSMLALVNRRRIWTTMDQIMDTYFREWCRIKDFTSIHQNPSSRAGLSSAG